MGMAELASTRNDWPRQPWSLGTSGWLPLLSKELKWLRVEVAALLEVRRPGCSTIILCG